MNVRAFLMLVSGGLFAGGVTALAWDRIPAWRSMPLTEFGTDLRGCGPQGRPGAAGAARGGHRGQLRLRPHGTRSGPDPRPDRRFRLPGDPLRIGRRLGAAPAPDDLLFIAASRALERMRNRWLRGHLGRTVVGVASFLLVAWAAAV